MSETTSCFCMNVLCSQAGRCLKQSISPTSTPTYNQTYISTPTGIEAIDQAKQAERRDLFIEIAKICLQIQPHSAFGMTAEEITETILKKADKFARGENE